MFEVGFGMLNLKPDEFWNLTVQEINALADGYRYRERIEWERTAWMTAHLMNATGNYKKSITIEGLLGHSFNSHPKKAMTKAERKEELRKIAEDIEKGMKRSIKGGV